MSCSEACDQPGPFKKDFVFLRRDRIMTVRSESSWGLQWPAIQKTNWCRILPVLRTAPGQHLKYSTLLSASHYKKRSSSSILLPLLAFHLRSNTLASRELGFWIPLKTNHTFLLYSWAYNRCTIKKNTILVERNTSGFYSHLACEPQGEDQNQARGGRIYREEQKCHPSFILTAFSASGAGTLRPLCLLQLPPAPP